MQLKQANEIDEAVDEEAARWQKRLDEHIVKACPNRDGSGCESGDALDLTEIEMQQAFRAIRDTALEEAAQRILTLGMPAKYCAADLAQHIRVLRERED